MPYLRSLPAALVLVLVSGCSAGAWDAADAADAAADCGPGFVPWDDVRTDVGQRVKIQGFVAGTGTDPDTGTEFVNLGNDYPDPDRLTLVAFPDASSRAHEIVAGADVGESLCIRGKLVSYEGSPQIHLK